MENNFLPYQESLELKELGFNEECAAQYLDIDDLELKWKQYRNMSINESKLIQAPMYQQAFRFFRDKYNFLYSIGKTNVSVYHIPVANYHSTFMLQDNASYEMAELETIKAFIEHAKSINL
jgi:hypothetical protein